MAVRAVDGALFDVNETLFPLDPLGRAFADAGLDPVLVPYGSRDSCETGSRWPPSTSTGRSARWRPRPYVG
jgi:hypothetical protein